MAWLQTSIVALLVPACALWAGWKLLPSAARRAIAAAALRSPRLPAAWRPGVERLARAGACGCDGCDHRPAASGGAAASSPPVAQPIVLHRRRG